MENNRDNNPLGNAPVSSLMLKFAIPSIIGMLVTALYNIVDQLFIGQGVGTNGNAATNIAFPFTTACMAVALLLGIGGASCFNLTLGRGDKKRAGFFAGNSIIASCEVPMPISSTAHIIPQLSTPRIVVFFKRSLYSGISVPSLAKMPVILKFDLLLNFSISPHPYLLLHYLLLSFFSDVGI